MDANGIIFGGGGVISAGSSSTSTTSWNVTGSEAVGRIAYFGTSAVDESFPNSRFIIMRHNPSQPATGAWGSKGTSRGLTDQDALNGYANTRTLAGYGAEAHPQACNVWNFTLARPEGASEWFMLSAGQWKLILTNNTYYYLSSNNPDYQYQGTSSTENATDPENFFVLADNSWTINGTLNGYTKGTNRVPTAFFVY